MKYGRTFNFSAGPAMMPEPVLEEIRDEMMNYRGSGMCVMEMSHRSPVFQQIIDEAEQDLRDLMGIPDNYKVLFIQGGATLQFSMIPMNLMKNGKAVYIETGAWSKKAIAEAKKVGEVIVAASSKDKNYTYVPDCSDLDIPEDTDYVYICENETIHGVTWNKLPNTKGHVLVSDQSSMFLSKPCNVSDYGMIYAGVQKNVGPAGMVVVIVREDLIRDDLKDLPIYLQYSTHAGAGSMYNAMPGIHHRKPGPIGAGSERENVVAELICDGQHIHPSAVRMAFKLFPGRICLISDALRCCGMPDGQYTLGGQDVFLQNCVARLADGTIAGSATNLYDCMRKAVEFGIPKEQAILSATSVPAKELGQEAEIGEISSGKLADFVVCDEELNRKHVYLSGTQLDS